VCGRECVKSQIPGIRQKAKSRAISLPVRKMVGWRDEQCDPTLQSYLQRHTARKGRGEAVTDSEATDWEDGDGTFEDDSTSYGYSGEYRQAESSKTAWMKAY